MAEPASNGVRAWLMRFGAAVAACDFDAARAMFADDVVAFGTWSEVLDGLDDLVARQWQTVWPTIEGFTVTVDGTTTVASPDGLQVVAVAPWSSTGFRADGSSFDRPGRATFVLRRTGRDGDWRCVHTHFSLARGVPDRSYGPAGTRRPVDHPYSPVRTADGRLAFVSGVIPVDDGGAPVTDPETAPDRALELLARRLADAGFTMADVVRTTVYLTDISWRPLLDAAYRRAFPPAAGPPPARTAVEVRALPRGVGIEIDAVVHVVPGDEP